jgi:hypothetical protein
MLFEGGLLANRPAMGLLLLDVICEFSECLQ